MSRSLGIEARCWRMGRTVSKRDIVRFHSITSSAMARSTDGMERPSASAVLRLITKSNLSGRCIGDSLALTPRKISAT